MIVTHYWYPLESLHRYDFIFLAAIAFQIVLLATKLETWRESLVIVVFLSGGDSDGAI
ncbi:membrane protein [Alishewanella longhuensis]